MQAYEGDIWRAVVRDGARAGGGETGPNPHPLSQRLAGLRGGALTAKEVLGDGELEKSAENSTAESVVDIGGEGEGSLRLDVTDENPRGPEGDCGTPTRGPPKTPKRNKTSSPQQSDVSTCTLAW